MAHKLRYDCKIIIANTFDYNSIKIGEKMEDKISNRVNKVLMAESLKSVE